MTEQPAYAFADEALARRLERTEGIGSVGFIDGRQRLFPDSGASWIDVQGTLALFDGPASPLTQTFGLGMFAEPTAADLARIETFFQERGAPVYHEVSPLAAPATLTLLTERGYRPIEYTSVMHRPIRTDLRLGANRPAIAVRTVAAGDDRLWADLMTRGWAEFADLSTLATEIAAINAGRDNAWLFVADCDGVPVAAGCLLIIEATALLAGASTVPEGRRRGAQLALLEHRLRFAATHGCDLAIMGARPGSASQRNAERHGFRIAYTRTKWQLGSAT